VTSERQARVWCVTLRSMKGAVEASIVLADRLGKWSLQKKETDAGKPIEVNLAWI